MVEDDPRENQNNNEDPQRPPRPGGGGLGSIASFLPLIFAYLGRSPKILILLLIVGAVLYFSGGGGFLSNILPGGLADLTKGCEMKQEIFDKAEVFEPLSNDFTALPARASLEKYCPKRLNQGEQGSCVAWSSAYSARTILQSAATGKDPNSFAFSPSFLYNQIGLEGCQGSYIVKAMDKLKNEGVVPLSMFPYDETDCTRQPNSQLKQAAAEYKMRGYNRLTEGGSNYAIDFNAIKQNIAQGGPVVIGMLVGGSFMQGMLGNDIWRPTQADYYKSGFGGHAMCCIGYDDTKEGGAFQIMNSWGNEWGKNGIAWVKYKDFQYFVKEAYGLYPLAKSAENAPAQFKVAFGLVENTSKSYITMNTVSGNTFKTTQPVARGTKFKIAVNNSVECYTYLFGQETDGSSYVLFPYTPKHSPYCGIVGTRLFPKDHSLQADNVGNKDFMAIVVTKKEIDYNSLNNKINSSKAPTYEAKVLEALGSSNLKNVKFAASNKAISFETVAADPNAAVAMILEVDKK